MSEPLYAAVDLGAGSGRVMLAGVGPGELRLEEVRRFQYPPVERDGHLRWPFAVLRAEVEAGLRDAGARALALGRPIHSVGVDSWGVDYGLLDAAGRLLEDPICYRDGRTAAVPEQVWRRVPRDEIFARTGIQYLVFNTIFQLAAHAAAGLPLAARRLLMIPDLLHHALTGRAVGERTNASTTQLLEARSGGWDQALIERLGLPGALLPELVDPGAEIGPLAGVLAGAPGLGGVRVVAPATHDTGSAVAGAPLGDGWAYVSSGTWSLVGIERTAPLLGPDVGRQNFTNEAGAFGTVRFLKNVMGLWLYESCRREWRAAGLPVEHGPLLAAAAALPRAPALLFPDDQRLFNPPDMRAAIAAQLRETGQPVPEDPPGLTRTILDSLSLRYASVLSSIEALTGRAVTGVHVVGGGSQNELLDQATADFTGKPVLAGPVEATALGNVLVQAVASGRFPSLAEARRHVREHAAPRRYTPRAPVDGELVRAYRALEARLDPGR